MGKRFFPALFFQIPFLPVRIPQKRAARRLALPRFYTISLPLTAVEDLHETPNQGSTVGGVCNERMRLQGSIMCGVATAEGEGSNWNPFL